MGRTPTVKRHKLPQIKTSDIKHYGPSGCGCTVRGLTDRATMIAHSPGMRKHEVIKMARDGTKVAAMAKVIGVPESVIRQSIQENLASEHVHATDKAKLKKALE